ncbi:hypothetical protein BDV41DRAFT_334170 [Aspergillus transmontanensis]|uniref:Uncharacterized protein n=1 Tax=Aspergillus transmontanensis TaxID=1034304 RepID=A0A5N6VTC4_9EURO|nr:hypothetical protein BDV41DRAFT_334170 [Aspergillus transmontanensis]
MLSRPGRHLPPMLQLPDPRTLPQIPGFPQRTRRPARRPSHIMHWLNANQRQQVPQVDEETKEDDDSSENLLYKVPQYVSIDSSPRKPVVLSPHHALPVEVPRQSSPPQQAPPVQSPPRTPSPIRRLLANVKSSLQTITHKLHNGDAELVARFAEQHPCQEIWQSGISGDLILVASHQRQDLHATHCAVIRASSPQLQYLGNVDILVHNGERN